MFKLINNFISENKKGVHMFAEAFAVLVFVPILLKILLTYKLSNFDRYAILFFIIGSTIFDVSLFINWYNYEKKDNINRKDMLNKLLRQSARWSLAAYQDNSDLVSVLHANYGAGYLWAIKDTFEDWEIEEILGSAENRRKFESYIVEIQDIATKKATSTCPEFIGETIPYLSKIAGDTE